MPELFVYSFVSVGNLLYFIGMSVKMCCMFLCRMHSYRHLHLLDDLSFICFSAYCPFAHQHSLLFA